MLESYEGLLLQKPVVSTGAGVTGSWVDLQGLVPQRSVKALLLVGAGTTPGTAGGYIQAADDTSGTGAVTQVSFSTVTATGGFEEKPFYTNQRYVRFVGTVQSGKDMILSCAIVSLARYRP